MRKSQSHKQEGTRHLIRTAKGHRGHGQNRKDQLEIKDYIVGHQLSRIV